MRTTCLLMPDPDGGYSALNPETGAASQGDSIEEAEANLREAVELYLESFPGTSPGKAPLMTFIDVLENA